MAILDIIQSIQDADARERRAEEAQALNLLEAAGADVRGREAALREMESLAIEQQRADALTKQATIQENEQMFQERDKLQKNLLTALGSQRDEYLTDIKDEIADVMVSVEPLFQFALKTDPSDGTSFPTQQQDLTEQTFNNQNYRADTIAHLKSKGFTDGQAKEFYATFSQYILNPTATNIVSGYFDDIIDSGFLDKYEGAFANIGLYGPDLERDEQGNVILNSFNNRRAIQSTNHNIGRLVQGTEIIKKIDDNERKILSARKSEQMVIDTFEPLPEFQFDVVKAFDIEANRLYDNEQKDNKEINNALTNLSSLVEKVQQDDGTLTLANVDGYDYMDRLTLESNISSVFSDAELAAIFNKKESKYGSMYNKIFTNVGNEGQNIITEDIFKLDTKELMEALKKVQALEENANLEAGILERIAVDNINKYQQMSPNANLNSESVKLYKIAHKDSADPAINKYAFLKDLINQHLTK